MSNQNTGSLPFFGLVQSMEEAIGYVTNVHDLIALIDSKQYLIVRAKIIDTFKIGELPEFDVNNFGSYVEFGDISDAIRNTTFSRYPQSTPMHKPISLEERKEWCGEIIKNMDAAASEDYG